MPALVFWNLGSIFRELYEKEWGGQKKRICPFQSSTQWPLAKSSTLILNFGKTLFFIALLTQRESLPFSEPHQFSMSLFLGSLKTCHKEIVYKPSKTLFSLNIKHLSFCCFEAKSAPVANGDVLWTEKCIFHGSFFNLSNVFTNGQWKVHFYLEYDSIHEIPFLSNILQ